MCVNWQNKCSALFSVAKGVRQGGILSPFLLGFIFVILYPVLLA